MQDTVSRSYKHYLDKTTKSTYEIAVFTNFGIHFQSSKQTTLSKFIYVQCRFCKAFLSSLNIKHQVISLEHWDKTLESARTGRAKVLKEELLEQDTRFLAVYVEAKNSCLILLSEHEDRLGTLAIAVPKPKELLGPVSSSILLGDKNAVSARMFAEYVAAKKGKIALVSVYLERLSELQAQSFFMHLIEKVIKKESESGKEAANV